MAEARSIPCKKPRLGCLQMRPHSSRSPPSPTRAFRPPAKRHRAWLREHLWPSSPPPLPMAGTTTLMKNLPMSGLLCLLLLAPMAAATRFKVGGSLGWRVPESGAESFNQWAERNRFQKGDSLLFTYTAGQDSVLLVSKDDYTNCNTGNPIQKFTDGSTDFTFSQTGAFHFISGVADNCNKGEKLEVVVMADRSAQSTATSPPPPSAAAPVKVVGAVGAVLGSLALFVL